MSYKPKTKVWKPSFNSKEEYMDYLTHTLIPDLLKSGNDATANDFKEAIFWINQSNPDESL